MTTAIQKNKKKRLQRIPNQIINTAGDYLYENGSLTFYNIVCHSNYI